MRNILDRLANCDRVVVAAVNGRAMGGGCEILLAAHFRIAAKSATFAFVHATKGLVTAWHGGTRLMRLVGRSRALELLLSASTTSAREAQRIGLIDHIVPGPKLLSSAIALCQKMGKTSPMATKAFLQIATQPTWQSAKRIEESWLEKCWVIPHFQRALADLSARNGVKSGNTSSRVD